MNRYRNIVYMYSIGNPKASRPIKQTCRLAKNIGQVFVICYLLSVRRQNDLSFYFCFVFFSFGIFLRNKENNGHIVIMITIYILPVQINWRKIRFILGTQFLGYIPNTPPHFLITICGRISICTRKFGAWIFNANGQTKQLM